PDGTKLLLAAFRSVRIIGLSDGLVSTYLTQDAAALFHATFAPDGKTLVGGRNNELRFFDIDGEKECGPNGGHSGPVLALRFTPDGAMLATMGHDDSLRLWDAGTGKELRRWDHRFFKSRALAFTADGRGLMACDDDGWLRQWDVRSGAEVKRWDRRDADQDWLQSAVLSGGGKL